MIRLEMKDWLYNSGLLGLYRVLKYNNDYVKVKANYIEFEEEALENFGTKYFNYLIDKYGNFTHYHRLVSYENKINNFDKENLDKENIDNINKIISDFNNIFSKASFEKEAFVILNDTKLINLNSKLEKINVKEATIEKLEAQLNIIKEIIDVMKQDEYRRILISKNVTYDIVGCFYEKVAMLNCGDGNAKTGVLPSTKRDMTQVYNNYFVNPIKDYLDYLNKDDKEVVCSCITCNNDIEELDKPKAFDLTFMKGMGVNVKKKSSYYYNLNRIAICPMCNIVYSCVPIGFNVLKYEGLFINQNSSFDKLIKANNISINDSDNLENLENKSYFAIVNSMQQDKVNVLNKELDNIQVIKLSEGVYSYNVLNKRLMNIIYNNKEVLEKLVDIKAFTLNKNVNIKFNKNNVLNIYKEVINRLYRNQNLFELIQKLMTLYLSDCYKNLYAIKLILKINHDFIQKGEVSMNNKTLYIVEKFGYELKKEYELKGASNKLSGITYRLLNALRTNNKQRFLDNILNAYMYINKPFDTTIMSNIYNNDDDLKDFGYHFLLGMQQSDKVYNYKKNE